MSKRHFRAMEVWLGNIRVWWLTLNIVHQCGLSAAYLMREFPAYPEEMREDPRP